jgi:hypothetical protein
MKEEEFDGKGYEEMRGPLKREFDGKEYEELQGPFNLSEKMVIRRLKEKAKEHDDTEYNGKFFNPDCNQSITEFINCELKEAFDKVREMGRKEAQAEFIKLLKDEHNSREDIIKQFEK